MFEEIQQLSYNWQRQAFVCRTHFKSKKLEISAANRDRCAFPAVPQMHPFPAVPQMVTPYQNKLYTGNNRVVYFTMAIMSVTHIYMREITEL